MSGNAVEKDIRHCIICTSRDFEFTEPELSVRMKEYEDCYIIEVSASHFAKAVGFDIIEGDCIFLIIILIFRQVQVA